MTDPVAPEGDGDAYGKAVLLLFGLADAARARARRIPQHARNLATAASAFELAAWRLRPQDTAEVTRINRDAPAQLARLRGPVTL